MAGDPRFALPALDLDIDARPDLVYQLVAAVGQGPDAAHARVIERPSPDCAIVEFRTKIMGREVRTLEEVRFIPPDRITYRLLRGPLPAVNEEFMIKPSDAGTRLQYSGSYVAHSPWPRTLFDRLVVPRLYRKAVWASMLGIKRAAEARQQKSRVFPEGKAGPQAS